MKLACDGERLLVVKRRHPFDLPIRSPKPTPYNDPLDRNGALGRLVIPHRDTVCDPPADPPAVVSAVGSGIGQYRSVDSDRLDVYGDPLTVRSPDGRSYFIRVLPAGFGTFPLVSGGFGLGALAFALAIHCRRPLRAAGSEDRPRTDVHSGPIKGRVGAPL